MTPEERENLTNEKLLQRLYKAAGKELAQHAAEEGQNAINEGDEENQDPQRNESAMGQLSQAIIKQHTDEAALADKKLNHEMWCRTKEHQERLKKVLVMEAKRDLYEKLLRRQAEQDQRNEDRARRMYEWEERKVLLEAIKKEEELKAKEKERLEKKVRTEKSYQAFKEWLKVSLLKQREEMIQKKIEKQ